MQKKSGSCNFKHICLTVYIHFLWLFTSTSCFPFWRWLVVPWKKQLDLGRWEWITRISRWRASALSCRIQRCNIRSPTVTAWKTPAGWKKPPISPRAESTWSPRAAPKSPGRRLLAEKKPVLIHLMANKTQRVKNTKRRLWVCSLWRFDF